MKGRAAVVTGSTSGIGMGIARTLAASGCAIMLNGFGEPAAIEKHRAELAREFHTRVLYHGADLSNRDECVSLVETAKEQFGSVDILVNNAGVQHVSRVESFPPDQWEAILALNLTAAFITIQTALPSMRQRGWGRILNIASTHGLVASVGKGAYVAAKHGLVGLTKVVALETAGSGITCNAICPGWVRTPLVEEQIAARAKEKDITQEEAAQEMLQEKQPTGAFTTIDQIGAFVAFLCTEEASNITGATLPIDGGWLAQ
jgi:3-hydroxybutyrate dehydrogenase